MEDVHLHVLEEQVDLAVVVMQDLVVYQVVAQKNVGSQELLIQAVVVALDLMELVDQE